MNIILGRVFPILTLIVLTGCGSAQNPPMTNISDIRLSQNDEKAIILLKAGNPILDYYLDIQEFDEQKNQINTRYEGSVAGSFLSGGLIGATTRQEISAALSTRTETIDGFIARKIDPGTYAISFFSQQGKWAACFNNDTLSFKIEPGEVLFLGELNYQLHFEDIMTNATENDDMVAINSEIYSYFDGIRPPQFSMKSEDDISGLEEAKSFITKNAPNIKSKVSSAVYKKVDFTTKSTLMLSGQSLCRSNRTTKN